MAPRKYRMTARADAVAATRARIVAAAMELHVSRGVQATSWEDIAAAAQVAPATTYRHFPSLAELVPACARTVFDLIKPPTVEEVRPRFAEYDEAADRFDHLVHATVHCYRSGEEWLHAAYRERDFVPELDAALLVIEDSLRVLISAAAGRRVPQRTAATLFALCNFPFYKQLTSAGLNAATTEDTLVQMVRDELTRAQIE